MIIFVENTCNFIHERKLFSARFLTHSLFTCC